MTFIIPYSSIIRSISDSLTGDTSRYGELKAPVLNFYGDLISIDPINPP